MTMKHYNLTDEQALNYESIDKILVMMKQPPDGWIKNSDIKINSLGQSYCFFNDPAEKFGQHPKKGQIFFTSIHLPFSVGDIVGCREKGAYIVNPETGNGKYCYKSDYPEDIQKCYSWYSTLKENIRKWCKIVSVDVKRVQDITIEQIRTILNIPRNRVFRKDGYNAQCRFINHFNSHYAKPKAIKEHGKIVEYVSYIYDNTPESRVYLAKIPNFHKYHKNLDIETGDKLGYYDTWKGLPLKTSADPYIAIYEVERIEK